MVWRILIAITKIGFVPKMYEEKKIKLLLPDWTSEGNVSEEQTNPRECSTFCNAKESLHAGFTFSLDPVSFLFTCSFATDREQRNNNNQTTWRQNDVLELHRTAPHRTLGEPYTLARVARHS